MSNSIKYTALLIFVVAVIVVAMALSDGIPIGRGPGGGPIIDP